MVAWNPALAGVLELPRNGSFVPPRAVADRFQEDE